MTGVLVSDCSVYRAERRVELERRQELGDIPHLAGKGPGLVSVLAVIFEQIAILLERRSAARSVGDDGVEFTRFDHRVDVAAGQALRPRPQTGGRGRGPPPAPGFQPPPPPTVLFSR